MGLAVIDYVILVGLLIGGLYVAYIGFARDVTTKAGYLAAFLVAMMFTGSLMRLVMNTFNLSPLLSSLISYLVLCIAAFIAFRALGTVMEGLLDGIGMVFLDKLLGFILGVFEAFVIIVFVLWLLEWQQVFAVDHWFADSVLINRYIFPIRDWAIGWIDSLNV